MTYEADLIRAKIRRHLHNPDNLEEYTPTNDDLVGFKWAVLWLIGAGDSPEAEGKGVLFRVSDRAAINSEIALDWFHKLLAKRGFVFEIPQPVFNAAAHEARCVNSVDPEGRMTLNLRDGELKQVEFFLKGQRADYWFDPQAHTEACDAA